MRLYALHDHDPELKRRGHLETDLFEAAELNAQGYGIFWVRNEFEGRRLLQNVRKINVCPVEMDGGNKRTQELRIRSAPLLPSLVVESRNGYHCYWYVSDVAPSNWDRIVKRGLVPALGGDPAATDPLRLLRAPGYLHQKNPAEPFRVTVVWENELAVYSEKQMLAAFPEKELHGPTPQERKAPSSFWGRVAALDGREAIRRLNGHWLCNGETFRLVEQSNGNANIVRSDGQPTPCWIRKDGRLMGATGGNSIAALCAWYRPGQWGEVARGLRELFPELEEEE